jgi:UrcA family protein
MLPVPLVAVALLATPCIGSRNAVYAADGRETASVRVSVKDLDIATQAGAAALYLRIRNAAQSACGSVDTALPEEKAEWDRCVDEAISRAVAKVGSARLTDYYLGRATHPPRVITTADISKSADRVR